MKSLLTRLLPILLVLASAVRILAENPANLPIPTTYVNDFAHILSPAGAAKIEDLCRQVHQKADAEIVVVTVNSLDDGMTIEEFTVQLEEKWKIGKKGEDRSALLVLVMNPHKLRVETGYGLEGILNDAKVGAILDQARPQATSGDFDGSLFTATQGLASVIATDKGVTLTATEPNHQYHYQQQAPQQIGMGQILLGIGFVILIAILIKTGNLGWALYLVMNLMGGGGGGGGRGGGDDEGGGFGGVGGGGSGGGGASRDF